MIASEFTTKAINIATKYKTLYVMGGYGAPLNTENKIRYTSNYSFNKQADRVFMISNASCDTFGFDCSCLIKGILWGWSGDPDDVDGGAVYASNGVEDVDANTLIGPDFCHNISTDFSTIIKGEIVWMDDHVGIYIGEGLVVESSPSWENKVQIVKLSARNWLKHGKLKYIEY